MTATQPPSVRSLAALVFGTALMVHQLATAGQPIHEMQVVASKYQFAPSTIQVTAGETVRLILTSADSVHSFAIPKLKIDKHIPKGGERVVLEFVAPPPGRYEIECSEFCGSGHGRMKAALVSSSTPTTSR